MGRFDPEQTNNSLRIRHKLTGRAGDPYEFAVMLDFEGKSFVMDGLSMGDMVEINRTIARAIKQARHELVEWRRNDD